MVGTIRFVVAALLALYAGPSAVEAHGFIKEWGVKGKTLVKAQKTNVKSSTFRAVSSNTGWIGSQFLTSKAIACGASDTPFGKVASPGGTFFATQGAGSDLKVNAGDTVQLVISGNPGQGWPHPKGHVSTYLAQCGGTDCNNFDATQGKFFKIQQEANGIQNTLRPAYDASIDGNRYNIQIPKSVPAGNYIMRFELIAFGQSSSAEGGQDQYYPFCGQLTVSGSTPGTAASKFATVSFPGAYKNGNINQNTVPGPAVLAPLSGSSSNSGSSPPPSSPGGAGLKLAPSAPACATSCLRIKITEVPSLAPQCSPSDGRCLCAARTTFVAAFNHCARDNCPARDLAAAQSALANACAAVGQPLRRSAGLQRMARTHEELDV